MAHSNSLRLRVQVQLAHVCARCQLLLPGDLLTKLDNTKGQLCGKALGSGLRAPSSDVLE